MNTEESYGIGLSDGEEEGVFVWESGHPLSGNISQHWSPGQPDNAGGNQDCALIWPHNGKSGVSNGMDDGTCTAKLKFFCQKGEGRVRRDGDLSRC